MKKSNANQRNLFAEMAILRLKEKLAGRDLSYAETNAEQQVFFIKNTKFIYQLLI